MIPALRIMRAYVAAMPERLVEALRAEQIQASADDLQSGQKKIADLEAQLSAPRTDQQEIMAIGFLQRC